MPDALDATSAGSRTAPVPPRASIAVLPFTNLTGDPTKDYFGYGMAEELITTLARIRDLKVPSRTSSFAYKDRCEDVRRIARELGVATVLEGSVRSAGERVRVTAQLVDASTGYHLWAQSFDRQFEDLFDLQDELASAIVQALGADLKGPPPASWTSARPTQDLEAYQLYMQARAMRMASERSLCRAFELYQQAIVRDPQFARAFSGLAETRNSFSYFGYSMPDALGGAERDARRALALDPTLADARAALGVVNAFQGKWLEAEVYLRAALSLDRNDVQTRLAYAYVKMSEGQLQTALAELRTAYSLAPADIVVLVYLAVVNTFLGFDADAVRYVDLAVELGYPKDSSPRALIYSNAAFRHQRYAEAAEHVMDALPANILPPGGAQSIRFIYAAADEPRRAPAAVAGLQSLVSNGIVEKLGRDIRLLVVEWYTILGALDAAYEVANQILDLSARSGTVGIARAPLWLPELRRFRQDPRFQAFATRLGLMEYWKQYGPPDDCELRDGKLICT
jgi:TolB-like protein/Tfp pilus assembly protein PilF